MKDISPLMTLIKFGSSSKLVFLKNNPNLVERKSSSSRATLVLVEFFKVLNLIILKIFLFFPSLCCTKKIGLPITINIKIQIKNINGDKIKNKKIDMKKSR